MLLLAEKELKDRTKWKARELRCSNRSRPSYCLGWCTKRHAHHSNLQLPRTASPFWSGFSDGQWLCCSDVCNHSDRFGSDVSTDRRAETFKGSSCPSRCRRCRSGSYKRGGGGSLPAGTLLKTSASVLRSAYMVSMSWPATRPIMCTFPERSPVRGSTGHLA